MLLALHALDLDPLVVYFELNGSVQEVVGRAKNGEAAQVVSTRKRRRPHDQSKADNLFD